MYNASVKKQVLNYSRDSIAHIKWSNPKKEDTKVSNDMMITYPWEKYIHNDDDVPTGG